MWFLAQTMARIAMWSILVSAIGYALSQFLPFGAFVVVIPFGILGTLMGVELVIPLMEEER